MVSQARGMSLSSGTWHSQFHQTAPLPAQWVTAVKDLEMLICQVFKKKFAESLASSNSLPVTL